MAHGGGKNSNDDYEESESESQQIKMRWKEEQAMNVWNRGKGAALLWLNNSSEQQMSRLKGKDEEGFGKRRDGDWGMGKRWR